MDDPIKRDDAPDPPEYLCTFPSCGCVAKGQWCPAPRSPAATRKAAMLDAGYDTPVDPIVNDPPDWIWYGVDNDGKIHTSLGRWQKHPCQVRYKLAEIQPTEHDHPINPAAIREAALLEAAEKATARWAARRKHADQLAEMDYPEAAIDAKTVSAKADEAEMIAEEILALIGEKK